MVNGVRSRMGDKAFFAALREVIADHRFGLATGNAVVAAWLSHSRRPKVLKGWLRGFLSQRSLAGPASRHPARLAASGTARLAASFRWTTEGLNGSADLLPEAIPAGATTSDRVGAS